MSTVSLLLQLYSRIFTCRSVSFDPLTYHLNYFQDRFNSNCYLWALFNPTTFPMCFSSSSSSFSGNSVPCSNCSVLPGVDLDLKIDLHIVLLLIIDKFSFLLFFFIWFIKFECIYQFL